MNNLQVGSELREATDNQIFGGSMYLVNFFWFRMRENNLRELSRF